MRGFYFLIGARGLHIHKNAYLKELGYKEEMELIEINVNQLNLTFEQ